MTDLFVAFLDGLIYGLLAGFLLGYLTRSSLCDKASKKTTTDAEGPPGPEPGDKGA